MVAGGGGGWRTVEVGGSGDRENPNFGIKSRFSDIIFLCAFCCDCEIGVDRSYVSDRVPQVL